MLEIWRALILTLQVAVPASDPSAPADASYLPELQQQARAQQLASDSFWHLLLHYRTPWRGGLRSQADGAGFFLARHGATDPQAELDADLAGFFAGNPQDPNAEHPQCGFPARYTWLKERLGFDETRLPERPCPNYEQWRAAMDPSGVTLVFASAFLNAPASMYGHTFLRFDRKRYPNVDLLANVVSYTATMAPVNPVVHTWKGLTGGFAGVFQAVPYYVKVHEYSDIESRDLWEYSLGLPAAGIERMLRHIWELDNTHFNYYFFDENCAYHLLSLLEIADPSLHLLDQFPVFTIPVDTLRAVVRVPGLVTSRTLRRAKTAVLEAQLSQLGADDAGLVKRLVSDLAHDNFAACTKLPQERQARVLEAAQSYLQYTYGSDVLNAAPSARTSLPAHRAVALVQARSDLQVRLDPVVAEDIAPPESGHLSSRVGIATGVIQALQPVVDVSVRMALHDLLDRQTGYTPDSALEMATLTLRVAPASVGRSTLGIESLDLFRIMSITPQTRLVRVPSWRVAAGWGRPPDKACNGAECGAAMVRGGPGWALSTEFFGHAVYYGFADLLLGAGPAFGPAYRGSVAGNIGLLWALGEAWRFQAEGGVVYPFAGDSARRWFWQVSASQSWAVSEGWALRAEAKRSGEAAEATAGIMTYF